jgi:hypothetical protein
MLADKWKPGTVLQYAYASGLAEHLQNSTGAPFAGGPSLVQALKRFQVCQPLPDGTEPVVAIYRAASSMRTGIALSISQAIDAAVQDLKEKHPEFAEPAINKRSSGSRAEASGSAKSQRTASSATPGGAVSSGPDTAETQQQQQQQQRQQEEQDWHDDSDYGYDQDYDQDYVMLPVRVQVGSW